jgi:hypothetical protein
MTAGCSFASFEQPDIALLLITPSLIDYIFILMPSDTLSAPPCRLLTTPPPLHSRAEFTPKIFIIFITLIFSAARAIR